MRTNLQWVRAVYTMGIYRLGAYESILLGDCEDMYVCLTAEATGIALRINSKRDDRVSKQKTQHTTTRRCHQK